MNHYLSNETIENQTAFFQVFILSAANYLSEFFFFIRGFFLARILGPETFGLWAQMKLVLTVSRHGSLGANDAMVREVPYLNGKGLHKPADDVKEAAAAINLALSTIAAILIALIICLLSDHLRQNVRAVWLILAFIFPMHQMVLFVKAMFRAEKRFGQLSIVILSVAFVTSIFGSISAFYFTLRGFLIVFGLCHVLVLLAVVLSKIPLHLPAYWIALSFSLIKTGLPIMVSRFTQTLLYNVDQIAIWLFLSKSDLGLYSIQTYIFTIVMLVPIVVSTVLYPRIMEAFGKAGDPEKLAGYLIQPTLVMGWLSSLALGVIFIWLHLPFKWLLPEYVLSISPGRVLLLASFFRVISNMPMTIHISLRKEKRLIGIILISVALCAVIDFIMIKIGYGLTGVAFGTTLGLFLFSCFTIGSATRILGLSMRRLFSFAALTFVPYLLILMLLGIVYFVIPEGEFPLRADLVKTVIRSIAFLFPALCLFSVIYIFHKKLLYEILKIQNNSSH
jgi:O-antigen/teichoic acid export membrane protein